MRKDALLSLIANSTPNFRARVLTIILMDAPFKTLSDDADIPFITITHYLQMNGLKIMEEIPQALLESKSDGDLFYWCITGKVRLSIHPKYSRVQQGYLTKLPQDIWNEIGKYCDIQTIANLSACSSTFYSYTSKQEWWEKRIMALGYNKVELEKVIKSRTITNYKLFYESLSENQFARRQHYVAWEMYCLSGNPLAIEEAIHEEKLNAGLAGFYGKNALHYAALSGSVPAIQFVIEKLGINLATQNTNGLCILHYAARSGHIKALKYVIEDLKIDKNKETKRKSTILHLAAESGNIELIKYIINDLHFAKESENDGGLNALHFAALNGKLRALKYFIEELQFDKTKITKSGASILFLAAKSGHIETMKYIVDDLQISQESLNNQGANVLHHAAFSGRIEAIKFAIEVLNIPKESTDNHGQNILFYSAGVPATLEYIVNGLGISLLSVNNQNMNVLHDAANKGDVEKICVLRLLSLQQKLNLDPSALDNHGHDAFYYAAHSEKPEQTKRALTLSHAELVARAEAKQNGLELQRATKSAEKCVVM